MAGKYCSVLALPASFRLSLSNKVEPRPLIANG